MTDEQFERLMKKLDELKELRAPAPGIAPVPMYPRPLPWDHGTGLPPGWGTEPPRITD